MKKFVVCILFSSFALQAAATVTQYDIVKKHGGPNGYDKIDQYTGTDSIILRCEDPGYEKCAVMAGPGGLIVTSTGEVDVNADILAHVDDLISDGNSSGEYNIGEDCTVSWNTDSDDNITISIQVQN